MNSLYLMFSFAFTFYFSYSYQLIVQFVSYFLLVTQSRNVIRNNRHENQIHSGDVMCYLVCVPPITSYIFLWRLKIACHQRVYIAVLIFLYSVYCFIYNLH